MKIVSLTAAAFLLTAASSPVLAGEVYLSAAGESLNLPVTSYKELRFRSIMLQQYDFSCGSAALASMLTYHYNRPHSEQDVFEAMYRVGDQPSIQKSGFSLLDMKTYLESIGMAADGFHVTLDKIAELQVPGITLVEVNGYKHFVIIKGVKGNRVLVGDPARGVRAMEREDFEKIWSGVVLLIRTDIAVAQASFNPEKDWSGQAKAPVASALRQQDIGSFTLHIRPSGLF